MMLLRLNNSTVKRKVDSGLKMLLEPILGWIVASENYKKYFSSNRKISILKRSSLPTTATIADRLGLTTQTAAPSTRTFKKNPGVN